MKFSRASRVAMVAVAAGALATATLTTASTAADRSTVVIVESNALTSLNPGVSGQNLTFNTDVAYVSSMGFWYYDNSPKIVPNKVFGSFKITKNTANDFRTTWTVNKGRVWSDGTPIDGVDLLLSHILASSEYSKSAGLGDPSKDEPAFNAGGYGGLYDEAISSVSLTPDKQGVTLKFKYPIPDWETNGTGPFPVHTLVLMAEGKKKLGTVAENIAAKQRFYNAYVKKDTAFLKKLGKIWSNAYNIKTVNAKTNPLLLVVNGPYQVKSAVADQSVTMVVNPKYNSGPKTNGIRTMVFRVVADGTPAAQALANREVDVYAGQATADALLLLRSIIGIKVAGYPTVSYEHLDFKHGAFYKTPEDKYTGLFSGDSKRAEDLRTAVALAWPREEIVEKVIKRLDPKAIVMQSLVQFPSEPGYKTMVQNSGVSQFANGTQAERTAKALALVKKYYPNASASNAGPTLKLLWGRPDNQRRIDQVALAKLELAKAGIKLDAPGDTSWSANRFKSDYDATFFIWSKSALVQDYPCGLYQSDQDGNHLGFNSKIVDAACERLKKAMPASKVLEEYLTIEKELFKDPVSLPIYQVPGVVGYRAELKGIKPAPLSPNIVWNFWEWKY